MSIDEGYIKYTSHWTKASLGDDAPVAELDRWRAELHASGLIGYYEELEVGFGNLSARSAGRGQFFISGTQTGQIERTTAEHYALVTRTDIAGNAVWSTGPIRASSEALTHAALYSLSDEISAVVHVHDAKLWRDFLDVLPTTNAGVSYGTPAMATEFERLWISGTFPDVGLAVMGGHEEGMVSIGRNLAEATQRILRLRSAPRDRAFD